MILTNAVERARGALAGLDLTGLNPPRLDLPRLDLQALPAPQLRRLMNLWPPFLAAGVQVRHLDPAWAQATVALRLRPWNRNYVGVQFGGSLFAMTDPFWMLLMMKRLGGDYLVWDSAARVEFVSPGRGDVFAQFVLDDARVEAFRAAVDAGPHREWFEVEVTAADGTVVARVAKQLYGRRKRPVTTPA